MSSLHELVVKTQEITAKLIETGGEIPPEMEQELIAIDTAMPEKVDSYKYTIDRLELEASYWKEQAAIRTKLAKAFENAAQMRKDAIKGAMKLLDQKELLGVESKYVLKRCAPKLILDENKLTKAYLIVKTEMVPDKDRIKVDLKDGKTIEGASLEENFALTPYMNKRV